MKYKFLSSRLWLTAVLATRFGSGCSEIENSQLATKTDSAIEENEARRAHGQQKWDELAAELRIDNNKIELSDVETAAIESKLASPAARAKAKEDLIVSKYAKVLSEPSAYLTDKNAQGDYTKRIFKIARQFSDKAYATRCAKIIKFEAVENIKPSKEVNVFKLQYKLQENKEGQAEEITRTGLVSIPKKEGTYPLLAFAHGDDQGLSYLGLERDLNSLQESHIVIAPSFPGEPVCAGRAGERNRETGERNLACSAHQERIASPVGESLPWDNDVDELLGMYDCVAKVAANQFEGNRVFADEDEVVSPYFMPQYDGNKEAIGRAEDESPVHKLSKHLADKVRFVEFMNSVKGFPLSSLAGASRGGLVASLALAKSGATWYRLLTEIDEKYTDKEQRKAFKAELFQYYGMASYLVSALPKAPKEHRKQFEDMFAFIASTLGKRYGLLPPPAFNGIVTLASPTSIIAGRLRLQLEQMVKGNADLTPGMFLPGLRQLALEFDNYRNGLENASIAADKILSRDMTFLAPLMFASLKRWDKLATQTRGTRNSRLLDRGSFLMFHHEKDRVVPFEQSQIAANILLGQNHNGFIREITMSPAGLELIAVPLVTGNPGGATGLDKATMHLDSQFYEKSHPKVDSNFIQDNALRVALNKSLFYGKSEGEELRGDQQIINKNIIDHMTKTLNELRQRLYGENDTKIAGFGFSNDELQDLFSQAKANVKNEGYAQAANVLRYYAVNGASIDLAFDQKEGAFTSMRKPAEIIEAWSKSLYKNN